MRRIGFMQTCHLCQKPRLCIRHGCYAFDPEARRKIEKDERDMQALSEMTGKRIKAVFDREDTPDDQ